jgi:fumarylacetoacetase
VSGDRGDDDRAQGVPAPYRVSEACGELNQAVRALRRIRNSKRFDIEREGVEPALYPLAGVELRLPFAVADYVDFYASEYHAANVGRIFRPGTAPLPANWKHLPNAYHGRSGTVVVSGSPVVRPRGQRKPSAQEEPRFGPTNRLDFEAEVGFVVGTPSALGSRVPADGFAEHVFGVCLVNDWSARDIQSWETAPLGPFLGKSFATSISAWVTPLAALDRARIHVAEQEPRPLEYLQGVEPWCLDLSLEVRVNGQALSRPAFSRMYWSPAQMLAHLTVNGACLRSGDLFASGTVSGETRAERGCLLEITWNGAEPITLDDGTSRTFLEDGDTVSLTATAPAGDDSHLALGEVTGHIVPAP